jgi:hypothetical protein
LSSVGGIAVFSSSFLGLRNSPSVGNFLLSFYY